MKIASYAVLLLTSSLGGVHVSKASQISNSTSLKPVLRRREKEANVTKDVLDGAGISTPEAQHATNKASDMERSLETNLVPSFVPVLIKAQETPLYFHIWGGAMEGNDLRLHGDRAYAEVHENSQFRVINIGSNKGVICLNDHDLCLHTPSSVPKQLISPIGGPINFEDPINYGGKEFYIINVGNNKALDVVNGDCSKGSNIQLWTRNNSPAQIFKFGPNGSIINVACNKALDINKASCDDGANLQLWDINGTPAQSFRVEGSYIINANCNKAIDVAKSNKADGTNIHLYGRNGTPAQMFNLVYTDGSGSANPNHVELYKGYQYAKENPGSQFRIVDHDGKKLICAANADLCLNTSSGAVDGSYLRWYGNQLYAKETATSQFYIHELYAPVLIRAQKKPLYLHIWGGASEGNDLRLHGDRAYAEVHGNSQFRVINIDSNKVVICLNNRDLCLYTHGGVDKGRHLELYKGYQYAKGDSNSQFRIFDDNGNKRICAVDRYLCLNMQNGVVDNMQNGVVDGNYLLWSVFGSRFYFEEL